MKFRWSVEGAVKWNGGEWEVTASDKNEEMRDSHRDNLALLVYRSWTFCYYAVQIEISITRSRLSPFRGQVFRGGGVYDLCGVMG